MSRYNSSNRLDMPQYINVRPLSKKKDYDKYQNSAQPRSSRAQSSRDEILPTNEDNFEQYSVPRDEEMDREFIDRNSIEDSFNQY